MKNHKVYSKIDGMFEDMYNIHASWFNQLKKNKLIDLNKIIKNQQSTPYTNLYKIRKYPYYIKWIIITEGYEGDLIYFLDNEFNKMYTIYTAE